MRMSQVGGGMRSVDVRVNEVPDRDEEVIEDMTEAGLNATKRIADIGSTEPLFQYPPGSCDPS
jgi:hypothetical protein